MFHIYKIYTHKIFVTNVDNVDNSVDNFNFFKNYSFYMLITLWIKAIKLSTISTFPFSFSLFVHFAEISIEPLLFSFHLIFLLIF